MTKMILVVFLALVGCASDGSTSISAPEACTDVALARCDSLETHYQLELPNCNFHAYNVCLGAAPAEVASDDLDACLEALQTYWPYMPVACSW